MIQRCKTAHPGKDRSGQRCRAWLSATALLPALASAQVTDDFVAGRDNRSGLTFSPDGGTAYWTEWNGEWGDDNSGVRTIFYATQADGEWTDAIAAPFSGAYSDDDPFVSPDGRWLYFTSDRPTEAAADQELTELDTDIWRYQLRGAPMLERLDLNESGTEYSPIVTAAGTLYFANGDGDLYRALAAGDSFGEPEPLGPAVNSATGEWNLWVSPDEQELVFEASSRATNVSVPGDLYYSWSTPGGWVPAVPITTLNTGASDLMPRFDADGTHIYYTTVPDGRHATVKQAEWAPIREALRADYAPTLVVANRSSHEVTFVDLAMGEVIARVATGEGPHLLSNVSSGKLVTTGYGDFPAPHDEPVVARPPFVEVQNARLTLINTDTMRLQRDAVIRDCRKPHASWIEGRRIYVTCENERQVAVVDLETGRIVARHDTRQDGSHVLGFEPVSQTLVVANTGSGSVTLIDVDSGDIRVVPAGAGSEGLAAIDGRIWVGNAGAGSVSVIDPRQARIMATIDDVCAFPIALDGRRRELVWVACFASAELIAIDKQSLAVERRIALDAHPLNLILHPDRELAYASLPRQNAIAEIDLATGRELRRLRVGIEPDGLRWANGR